MRPLLQCEGSAFFAQLRLKTESPTQGTPAAKKIDERFTVAAEEMITEGMPLMLSVARN